MYRTLLAILALMALCSLSGCLERIQHEIYSPCVANQWAEQDPLYASDLQPRDPCIRRPVNDWWRS